MILYMYFSIVTDYNQSWIKLLNIFHNNVHDYTINIIGFKEQSI